jgi:hypothetical protein
MVQWDFSPILEYARANLKSASALSDGRLKSRRYSCRMLEREDRYWPRALAASESLTSAFGLFAGKRGLRNAHRD